MANEPSLAIGPSDVRVAGSDSVVDHARSNDSHAVPATLSFADTSARSTTDTSVLDSAQSIPAASAASAVLGTRRHETSSALSSSSTTDVGVTRQDSSAIGQVVTDQGTQRPTFGPVTPIIKPPADRADIRRQIQKRNGGLTTESLGRLVNDPDGLSGSVVMTYLARVANEIGMGLAADRPNGPEINTANDGSQGFEAIKGGALVHTIQRVEANPTGLARSLGRGTERGAATGRSSGLGGIAG